MQQSQEEEANKQNEERQRRFIKLQFELPVNIQNPGTDVLNDGNYYVLQSKQILCIYKGKGKKPIFQIQCSKLPSHYTYVRFSTDNSYVLFVEKFTPIGNCFVYNLMDFIGQNYHFPRHKFLCLWSSQKNLFLLFQSKTFELYKIDRQMKLSKIRDIDEWQKEDIEWIDYFSAGLFSRCHSGLTLYSHVSLKKIYFRNTSVHNLKQLNCLIFTKQKEQTDTLIRYWGGKLVRKIQIVYQKGIDVPYIVDFCLFDGHLVYRHNDIYTGWKII